jgi:hypothetical protein
MPKFKKHIQEAREKYAIHLLSKNDKLSDMDLNRSMKAKFGHALHYKTAKVLREEAKKQSSGVNDSWKDEQTMAAKKTKPSPKIVDLNDTTTGEEEIKNLALEMMKVMENSPLVSCHVYKDENGRGQMILGVRKIEKRQVQLGPRDEA